MDSPLEVFINITAEFELFYYAHYKSVMLGRFSASNDPEVVKRMLLLVG